jgi:hypothetical protein
VFDARRSLRGDKPADNVAADPRQAKHLFDSLLESDDRAVPLLLTQLLARLSEATNR